MVIVLWAFPAVVELGGVLLVHAGMPDVTAGLPVRGSALSALVVSLIAVTLTGSVAARIGVHGRLRLAVGGAQFVAAGLTTALGLALLTSGGVLAVFTLLLAHAALSMAMVGRAVLRAPDAHTATKEQVR
ncbi:hypothetical protein [Actinoplanes sp. NBRC 101535]|uniref:hypothetical protein n=1 Tax=Actinoplanes sp. NBRC 101535 TaxID=3032196 RepID=UPI002552BF03|nr:hypothetical protein [Actinoplanes sp. NBRC 101535]